MKGLRPLMHYGRGLCHLSGGSLRSLGTRLSYFNRICVSFIVLGEVLCAQSLPCVSEEEQIFTLLRHNIVFLEL